MTPLIAGKRIGLKEYNVKRNRATAIRYLTTSKHDPSLCVHAMAMQRRRLRINGAQVAKCSLAIRRCRVLVQRIENSSQRRHYKRHGRTETHHQNVLQKEKTT